MKIIVTGSLGHIGKPLTQELVAKGHEVTVISSNPEKKAEIEALGAKPAIGKLDDVAFLTSTFTGADALFAMEPPNYASTDLVAYYEQTGNNYAEAVKKTGLKRVVHLSSYGAHLSEGTGMIVGSHRVENILNALDGVSVTHLRPGYFYYNLDSLKPMIKNAGIMGANYGGEDRLPLVAPSDIGAAAAEELTKTSGPKVRYIVSDERTCNEVAAVIGRAIGKPGLQWLTFSDEQYADGLSKAGLPPHFAAMLTELGASVHSGKLREDYDKHKPPFSKVKLEDYVKEYAKDF